MRRHRDLRLALLLPILIWLPAPALGEADQIGAGTRVYLEISPDGRDDLDALFETLEASVAAGEPQPDPVVIVLHGPEAEPFLRRNYLEHQPLVDRAAKLKAFNRIDMRMCETWMRNNGIAADELLPFVETIPLAPEEVRRLERDGYLPYSAVRPRSPLL